MLLVVALVNQTFPEWTHIEMRFERCIGTAAVSVEVFFFVWGLSKTFLICDGRCEAKFQPQHDDERLCERLLGQ